MQTEAKRFKNKGTQTDPLDDPYTLLTDLVDEMTTMDGHNVEELLQEVEDLEGPALRDLDLAEGHQDPHELMDEAEGMDGFKDLVASELQEGSELQDLDLQEWFRRFQEHLREAQDGFKNLEGSELQDLDLEEGLQRLQEVLADAEGVGVLEELEAPQLRDLNPAEGDEDSQEPLDEAEVMDVQDPDLAEGLQHLQNLLEEAEGMDAKEEWEEEEEEAEAKEEAEEEAPPLPAPAHPPPPPPPPPSAPGSRRSYPAQLWSKRQAERACGRMRPRGGMNRAHFAKKYGGP